MQLDDQHNSLPLLQLVERNEEFDWTRHAMMTSFGFLYLGSFQYLLYNRLYACVHSADPIALCATASGQASSRACCRFVQWCGGITAHVGHVGVAPLKTLMDQGIQ